MVESGFELSDLNCFKVQYHEKRWKRHYYFIKNNLITSYFSEISGFFFVFQLMQYTALSFTPKNTTTAWSLTLLPQAIEHYNFQEVNDIKCIS